MKLSAVPLLGLLSASHIHAASFLVEAEQFSDYGGWNADTEFIESMGSPYLIAHGLGEPVAPASTTVQVPEDGEYKVWVRTVDWTRRLGRPGSAGTFTLSINGEKLGEALGNEKPEWHWQLVGSSQLKKGEAKLSLNDLTGYDGRVDTILFSSDKDFTPPENAGIHERLKWDIAGSSQPIEETEKFDLVVVGGGYGGLGASISAARMGLKVALIQNRDVLGGNGSSEVRVWAMGNLPPSEYKLADIIEEIQDEASKSPAPAEEFVDDKKEQVVRAEKNITLFLGNHAYGVNMNEDKIASVDVLEVKTGKLRKVPGTLFVDCTGHGFIGQWAGADIVMEEGGRMGMSNMWMWENTDSPQAFKEQDWMLKFGEDDFPYPREFHAQWFWESGFDSHPIDELETTRDYNLLANFSAWNAIKNYSAFAGRDPNSHANAKLSWMAYIGGTRETQQILGDVVLNFEDIEKAKIYDDALVLTTWSIDLHEPEEKYIHALPEHPFISKAIHRRLIDRNVGYPVPYRCLYSRNVPNLFTAGRNISVTRDALGTIRVMKTIGMMGVGVGRVAALCVLEDCLPRDVYEKHLDDAKLLWRQPGDKRFEKLDELRGFIKKSSDKN
ncbi:FAD-dependent oxidoreductase [Luteolibacter algae]|uniref:FAD-dependent oxidoreductase n=1 Tax=Luteolibacter algae TaxID=454151 RepID=A0ABW5DC01_9BACT